MSSLNMRDKWALEEFLGMSSGYVLTFSDRTFDEFVHKAVDIEIHSDKIYHSRHIQGQEAARILENRVRLPCGSITECVN